MDDPRPESPAGPRPIALYLDLWNLALVLAGVAIVLLLARW